MLDAHVVASNVGAQGWNPSSYSDFLCSCDYSNIWAHNLLQAESSDVCLHSGSADAVEAKYINFS